MWQTTLFIVFCLFMSSKGVHSLSCYTSDFQSVQLGKVEKLSYKSQDCGVSENNVTWRCYTVKFSADVIFGGCVQSGGCHYLIDLFKKNVQEAVNDLTTDGQFECMECSTSNCNEIYFSSDVESTNPAPLKAPRGETSLKCYRCLEPCETAKARKSICGQSIGKSHEAVCSMEMAKNSTSFAVAVRKCLVIHKNQAPSCPENSDCKFCKTDLCNADTTVSVSNSEALKCYFCLDACEVSKAAERSCGEHIGDSQEAVCTKDIPNDVKDPKLAVRKCQIIPKGAKPACTNAECNVCKTDLCNSAPVIGSNVALLGVVVAYFVTKFLY